MIGSSKGLWVPKILQSSALAALIQLTLPLRVRAENRVNYRYEDYIEDNDRIRVRTHSVYVEQELNSKVAVKGNFIYDGISGATPN